MLNLRYKADKSILEKVIAEANGKDANAYTAESYAVLEAAVAEANAVMANEDATQEEVDAAVTSVQEAMKGLVAVEKPSTETPDDNKAGRHTNRARIYHNKSKRSQNRRRCSNRRSNGTGIGRR